MLKNVENVIVENGSVDRVRIGDAIPCQSMGHGERQEAHGRLLQAKADLADAAQPHSWHKKTDIDRLRHRVHKAKNK